MPFPISRDPPEGGTSLFPVKGGVDMEFPNSRDPPDGGTARRANIRRDFNQSFQFLGIPPKGELVANYVQRMHNLKEVSNF